jgi:2-phospho-L-lactate guanylyltransferase
VSWTVVIPVKSAEIGKSRLGRTPDVARAIALDTIAAALATGARIVVVTADRELAEQIDAEVVFEAAPAGLAAAIAAGLPSDESDRAVLLGDLPALRPEDLTAALTLADQYPRSFVADAEGTGSTLVTARSGLAFVHHFGPSSAERHRADGLAELAVPADSVLRRDVDLDEHLWVLGSLLGPRTREALGL